MRLAIIDQNGALVAIQLTNIGSGYTSPPIVNITPSNGASASATIDTDVINNATRIAGTNRYFIEWVPQDPGTYNISVEGIDNDFSSTILSSDRYITIVPESSSKTPTISLLGPTNGEYYTSGSKLRIYAQADDPDGTLEWVRFYVNGEPYKRPLTAHSGIGSVNFPYGVEWTVPAPGTYTFSASAMDNSGNGIMSGISTITSTTQVKVFYPRQHLSHPFGWQMQRLMLSEAHSILYRSLPADLDMLPFLKSKFLETGRVLRPLQLFKLISLCQTTAR
ncbi:MAG: Ig-like domain-containing protein [Opitutales bacterium]